MNDNLPERKVLRYKHCDYNEGIVFITICTLERKQILSKVVGSTATSNRIVGDGAPGGPKASAPLPISVGTDVPGGPKASAPHPISVGTDVLGGPKASAPHPISVGTDAPGGPHIELLPHGTIVNKYINQLNDFYEHINIAYYVVMPNHIHLLLHIKESDRRGRRSLQNDSNLASQPDVKMSVVSKFISTLKRFCNKEIGENIFQRSYFDHVIRSDKDLDNDNRKSKFLNFDSKSLIC